MYKSKVRSMQRGAVSHGRSGRHEPIVPVEPVLRKQELLHFGIGDEGREAFVAELLPMIRAFARAGYRKPRDVSRLLNRSRVKTFAGHHWTPRLTFFLLSYAFADSARMSAKGSRKD